MVDPNITMEEYMRLEEEKALSRGKTFNWQTATYGKMEYCEDEDDCFANFESEFPAILLDDTLTSREALSWEPIVDVSRRYQKRDTAYQRQVFTRKRVLIIPNTAYPPSAIRHIHEDNYLEI
ncbi:hypothetical protein Tco_0940405 [Tanacetum coccineum]|uniref:Uncharacterized protein n=1 Tax=Tanacetum coccineum TaxID=301880 RepID=A0ABQ5DNI7_9ASTR